MIFRDTSLPGAFVVDVEPRSDSRGFFARSWCRQEFESHGLVTDFPQANLSVNPTRGTLRGLHYQRAPFEEVKLVRCTKGALYDVIVDLRPRSPTFRRWYAVELSADNHRALYVPKDFAHGFQTLTDNTEAQYMVSAYYQPGSEAGLRYDDPSLEIHWPLPVSKISDKDKEWPLIASRPPQARTEAGVSFGGEDGRQA